jgi:hypothetical protein
LGVVNWPLRHDLEAYFKEYRRGKSREDNIKTVGMELYTKEGCWEDVLGEDGSLICRLLAWDSDHQGTRDEDGRQVTVNLKLRTSFS